MAYPAVSRLLIKYPLLLLSVLLASGSACLVLSVLLDFLAQSARMFSVSSKN